MTEIVRKSAEKKIEAESDNAALAAQIKKLLLQKVLAELQNMPENMGTETRVQKSKEVSTAYRLRDIAATLKDLTDDMPKDTDNSRNAPIFALLERLNNE